MKAAGDVPVTVKMRKGIDEDHLTYLEAGRAAEGAGAASIALHARTAAEFYSGTADWNAITELKNVVSSTPVLGNGDIWSADDAIRMVEQTGADGVVVGRGCLGRPWLFGDLAAAFSVPEAVPEALEGLEGITAGSVASRASATGTFQPDLGFVADAFRRHAELLVEFFEDENRACRDIRKHVAWYFKGYPVGGETRAALAMSSSLQELDDHLAKLDRSQPYPGAEAEGQRGRAGAPKRPTLPYGWLDSRELQETDVADMLDGEVHNSGRLAPGIRRSTPSAGCPSSTPAGAATSPAIAPACCTRARCAGSPPRPRC